MRIGDINIALKKLEAHFKGIILGNDVSLISAQEEYNRKADLAGSEVGLCIGNPVRTLWELKGLKWPSSPEISSVCHLTSSHTGQLAPATIQEEEEQLKTALIKSHMSNFYQPAAGDDSLFVQVPVHLSLAYSRCPLLLTFKFIWLFLKLKCHSLGCTPDLIISKFI